MSAKQTQKQRRVGFPIHRPAQLPFTAELLSPEGLLGQVHIGISPRPYPHLTLSVVSLATPSFTTLAM